jgi:hypothetical protein
MDSVLDSKFRTLFMGEPEEVLEWLRTTDNDQAKMVCVGEDMQLLSISEYVATRG